MTETILQLDIPGYQGLPLANTFFKQSSGTQRLAIVFPGRGYSCAMPVLYYPARWLSAHGANVLTLEYSFTRKPQTATKLTEEDLLRWLAGDAAAALRAGLETGQYTDLVLVGKSLGTLALSQVLAVPETVSLRVSLVWLTPLFNNPILRAALTQFRPRSLFVQGDADPHFAPAFFKEMTAVCSAQTLLVPGADHSLEQSSDFAAALTAIQRLLAELALFTGW